MKKLKKGVVDIMGISMMGSAGSIALGSLGGSSATAGQQGISNATSFLSPTGTMLGAGAMFGVINKSFNTKKRRKRK